ncbi:MAG: hypothetical protein QM718_08165 [Steroidobacteraceae bacterium]
MFDRLMSKLRVRRSVLVLVAVAGGAAASAQAGEGLFGFVYTLDTQPKGTYELEQRVDVTHGQAVGGYNLGLYRTELEYGLTDNLQIAGYVNVFSIDASRNYLSPEMCENRIPCTAGFGVPSSAHDANSYHRVEVDGGSVEAIWRLSNPVTSPVGVGLYVEPTLGKLEDELEVRLLLQSNFIDDRLILAANFLYEPEREKYDPAGVIRNSMGDILYGASYRFASRWSAGFEGRFHTDHDGYFWNKLVQIANFVGPDLHYADQKWWATLSWRHQLSGRCYNDGTADCAEGYNMVWDNHGRDQFVLKFGLPFE